ncbi:hypothetical protein KTO58_09620 [Chitinophaga pendula]|uniref:hypothetical protein n=1 Tax=Chitinophaga TaxID=79328 RepID=UPI0012FDE30B|nr:MULTISPECIES: hypothetical protein [Chitinophaga]UCJ09422.1 hypothetical protein KTO58_09620 [Chitinophaga pendula]
MASLPGDQDHAFHTYKKGWATKPNLSAYIWFPFYNYPTAVRYAPTAHQNANASSQPVWHSVHRQWGVRKIVTPVSRNCRTCSRFCRSNPVVGSSRNNIRSVRIKDGLHHE